MGAKIFLTLPKLPDAVRSDCSHAIDLTRVGDHIYLKVSLAAPTGNDQAYCADGSAYTGSISADLRLNRNQLHDIQNAITDALGSFGT